MKKTLRLKILILLTAVAAFGCKQDDSGYLGYAEGEYIYVASPIGGRLDDLAVYRGQTVEEGAPLFYLESRNEIAEVNEARANLEDLETGKRPVEINVLRAQLEQAVAAEQLSAKQLVRDEKEYKIGAISKETLDSSRTANQKDKAYVVELQNQLEAGELPARIEQIRAAEALLAQAEWKLDQKSVQAPKSGLIIDTLFTEGEWVEAGSPVISQLPPANIKIRFFVPENDLGKLKIGDPVTVNCDGCEPDIPASISYISQEAEYTPPVIYSNTMRKKLVFMIEARTRLEDAYKLHPGQPIEVSLDEK